PAVASELASLVGGALRLCRCADRQCARGDPHRSHQRAAEAARHERHWIYFLGNPPGCRENQDRATSRSTERTIICYTARPAAWAIETGIVSMRYFTSSP